MNWMFFRSSSALPRDPMQMKWRLLISKINWKKQKVRSTTQLRNSQMASILYLFCYKSLSKQTISSHESDKYKAAHLEDSLMVSVYKLNSCPSSHFNHVDFWISSVGRNSEYFRFSLLKWAATCPSGGLDVPPTK